MDCYKDKCNFNCAMSPDCTCAKCQHGCKLALKIVNGICRDFKPITLKSLARKS